MKPKERPAIAEAIRAAGLPQRKPTEADRPPSTFPGRRIKPSPGQLDLFGNEVRSRRDEPCAAFWATFEYLQTTHTGEGWYCGDVAVAGDREFAEALERHRPECEALVRAFGVGNYWGLWASFPGWTVTDVNSNEQRDCP